MKSIVFSLSAILFSAPAFATPLSAIKSASITPSIELRTWASATPSADSLQGSNYPNGGTDCSIDFVQKGATNSGLRIVAKEAKQDGFVYTYAPSSTVSLQAVSSTSEVIPASGNCNGEPELCDTTPYTRRVETLTLVDLAANEFTVRCYGTLVAPPAQPGAIDASTIKINGLQLK